MKAIDYLLLILIGAAFVLAVRHIVRRKRRKKNCSGSCDGCMGCGYSKR
ncbi:MAG: FeoB-associated Cys-rich membrane protein [Blautia sp.]|nr:FeoB-associated Cys-rich membrane protein [Blautia sp.]